MSKNSKKWLTSFGILIGLLVFFMGAYKLSGHFKAQAEQNLSTQFVQKLKRHGEYRIDANKKLILTPIGRSRLQDDGVISPKGLKTKKQMARVGAYVSQLSTAKYHYYTTQVKLPKKITAATRIQFKVPFSIGESETQTVDLFNGNQHLRVPDYNLPQKQADLDRGVLTILAGFAAKEVKDNPKILKKLQSWAGQSVSVQYSGTDYLPTPVDKLSAKETKAFEPNFVLRSTDFHQQQFKFPIETADKILKTVLFQVHDQAGRDVTTDFTLDHGKPHAIAVGYRQDIEITAKKPLTTNAQYVVKLLIQANFARKYYSMGAKLNYQS